MNDVDERLSALENRLNDYERLIERLIAWARLTAGGRAALKALGLS